MKFPCFDVTFVFNSCCFSFDFASSMLIHTLSSFILSYSLFYIIFGYFLSCLSINNNINILFLMQVPTLSLYPFNYFVFSSLFSAFSFSSLLQPACSYLPICCLLLLVAVFFYHQLYYFYTLQCGLHTVL